MKDRVTSTNAWTNTSSSDSWILLQPWLWDRLAPDSQCNRQAEGLPQSLTGTQDSSPWLLTYLSSCSSPQWLHCSWTHVKVFNYTPVHLESCIHSHASQDGIISKNPECNLVGPPNRSVSCARDNTKRESNGWAILSALQSKSTPCQGHHNRTIPSEWTAGDKPS